MVAKSCRNCGIICAGSLCQDCRNDQERKRNRPTASQRGYGARYRANRLSVLQRARAGEPCCICGQGFTVDELDDVTAEHVVAVRHGGSSDAVNLAPAHPRCNYGWNRQFRP
jgi:5-methylcytosine-specific restriction endonuclease McrA